MQVRSKDLFWGYFTDIFVISSGVITLPIILNLLSDDEIGLNYLMLSIASVVSLIDFGFTPQFSRNLTYIFSGAEKLNKEGVNKNSVSQAINYRLLSLTIKTSKIVYAFLGILTFILMISLVPRYKFYSSSEESVVYKSIHQYAFFWKAFTMFRQFSCSELQQPDISISKI